MTHITQSPSLSGDRVSLRAAHAGDEEYLLNAGRHAEISRMYGVADAVTEPVSRAQAIAWLKHQIETPYNWVIEHRNAVIGGLRFHSFNQTDRRASFAIGLFAPKYLGKGLGTEAMALAVEHGFNALNLHRITLRVLHYNLRAIAAYKKLGFILEGRERQSACVGNVWHDDLIMGLLSHEFVQNRQT